MKDVAEQTLKLGQEILSLQKAPPKRKRARIQEDVREDELEGLPRATVYDGKDSNDGSSSLTKVWKVPLLMCIDSPPLIINRTPDDTSDVVVAGSQGGDLAILDSATSAALFRTRLPGKIEGGPSYYRERRRHNDDDPPTPKPEPTAMLFVPTYEVRRDESKGAVHAFRLSPSNVPTPAWRHDAAGEVKSTPVTFAPSNPTDRRKSLRRILVACYAGYLSYLDAEDGVMIVRVGNLGGTVHADPVVCPALVSTEAVAIVASCTWKGRVTCLRL